VIERMRKRLGLLFEEHKKLEEEIQLLLEQIKALEHEEYSRRHQLDELCPD